MSLRDRWARLSLFWRHTAINLALGLLIEFLIHVPFHDAPVVVKAENAGLDAAISFFGAWQVGREQGAPLAYTVLDIDEATWRAWQSPLLTPRARLLTLLRTAAASNPAAIVVDLDVTRLSGVNGLTRSADDDSLAAFFRKDQGKAPIVLVRGLEEDLGGVRHPDPNRAWFETAGPPLPPRVHWGTTRYVQEIDGGVRRWRLWEPVCRDGVPAVLPSIQLAVGAALDGMDRRSLDSALAPLAPESCNREAPLRPGGLRVFGHTLEPGEGSLPERIIYSVRWPPDDHSPRMVKLPAGAEVPLLVRIPASQLTEAGGVDRRVLEGRVVVIGGSYADSRDSYSTPLGEMPGFAVVINAIESLRANGQYGEASKVLKYLVMIALIVFTSMAYARFHPLVATALVLPLIYFAVLPISFYLFQSGAWLDFTAPILGVQLHELIASAEDAWAQRGRRFHREPHA